MANRQVERDLLPEAEAMIPKVGRLPGIDGKAKMSKSLGNAIPLSTSPDEIRSIVRQMHTAPNHLRAADLGVAEGNVVFTYLDAFCEDVEVGEDLKARYRQGGLGDMVVKPTLRRPFRR